KNSCGVAMAPIAQEMSGVEHAATDQSILYSYRVLVESVLEPDDRVLVDPNVLFSVLQVMENLHLTSSLSAALLRVLTLRPVPRTAFSLLEETLADAALFTWRLPFQDSWASWFADRVARPLLRDALLFEFAVVAKLVIDPLRHEKRHFHGKSEPDL